MLSFAHEGRAQSSRTAQQVIGTWARLAQLLSKAGARLCTKSKVAMMLTYV